MGIKLCFFNHQFIFEKASFPQSHASTIAETPAGLVAAWFGGTKEGNKDVCIWTSHRVNNTWTAPEKAADGSKEKAEVEEPPRELAVPRRSGPLKGGVRGKTGGGGEQFGLKW